MTTHLDPRVIDFRDDGGALLKEACAGREVPSVLGGGINTREIPPTRNEDYALVVKVAGAVVRKFPIIDGPNALRSGVYLTAVGKHLPATLFKEASERLSTALAAFGHAGPAEDLTKQACIDVGLSKEANDQYILDQMFGEPSDAIVVDALVEEFNALDPDGKREMAKQASAQGVEIPELSDYSAEVVGSDFVDALATRRLYTGFAADACNELDSLQTKVAFAEFGAEEAIEALKDFDSRHDISGKYSKVMPDPYVSVLGNSKNKTASAQVDVAGRTYRSDDIISFSQGSSDMLADKFGDEFRNQFVSNPVDVLTSLPHNHQSVIADMMDAE
jgi:hypothetical protein